MKLLTYQRVVSSLRVVSAGVAAFAIGGCSLLTTPPSPPPSFYALNTAPGPSVEKPTNSMLGSPLTLIVNPLSASSGFDSQRMVYVRSPYQLEYFAHSEWVDTPARMLGPVVVTAIQHSGTFATVVLATGTAVGDLRLNTEIIRLQHNFEAVPSRVQLTLRAYLTDEKTHRVLAWQDLKGEAIATTASPQGGVAAAHVAVQQVLTQLVQFLANRSGG